MKKMNKNGKLVVLEGIDGSGKGTQAKLLRERLAREGFETEAISFPQYGKKSAGLIEEYLNGTYEDVNPYAASLFYAVDRFESLPRSLHKGDDDDDPNLHKNDF